MTRRCTCCGMELTLEQVVFSSDYPDAVQTRTGRLRLGALKDAERVWCGAACARASWAARK